MHQLLELDKDLFLFFNGFHSMFFDQVMPLLTENYVWIPLYLIFGFLIVRKYKKNSVFVLIAIALVILICDRITSGIMKPIFERLRPSHDPSLVELVHIVDGYRGGLYGFASSHAANTFGIATLLWLSLRSHYKWIAVIFVWALVIAYTRIYLGVHYPSDILVGSIIGVFIGWIVFRLQQHAIKTRKPLQ
jgi:undecaprenyl-diphosphatase